VSIHDLARLLIELNEGGHCERIPFSEDLKRIDIGDYCGDFRRFEGELGWRPRVTLREGLRQTLAYYRQHGKAYLD
jgi:nucleoside-diphosphate-sugar epimerase